MELDWKSNLIAAKKAKLSEDGSFWCWIEQTERFKSRSKERKRKKVCSLLSNIEKHEGKIIEKRRKKDIWQTADGKKRELINQRDRKPRPSGWNLKIFECKAQKMKTAKSPLDHRFFFAWHPFSWKSKFSFMLFMFINTVIYRKAKRGAECQHLWITKKEILAWATYCIEFVNKRCWFL